MPLLSVILRVMIYLDWASTTPPSPCLLDEYLTTSKEFFANPSSLHREGVKSGELLHKLHMRCATLLKCSAEQLYFTSGGTESNNLVVTSLLKRRDKGRLIISGLEHPSLWEPVQALKNNGWEIKALNPGTDGRISPQKLKKLLDRETKMVIIMAVHNETGVIQPMEELIALIREQEKSMDRAIHIHSDLVQTAGKIPFNLQEWDLDSASFSAHKIQGPRGIGLLYLKKRIQPLYTGGGQEMGIRPGTENLAGAASLTKALEQCDKNIRENLIAAKERMAYLVSELSPMKNCRIIPEDRLVHPDHYSPWILSLALPPLPGEVLVRVMDEAGFAISTGSACSANKKNRTRALEAMGVDQKTAFSSIRVSQGPETTMEEIKSFTANLKEQAAALGQAVYRS